MNAYSELYRDFVWGENDVHFCPNKLRLYTFGKICGFIKILYIFVLLCWCDLIYSRLPSVKYMHDLLLWPIRCLFKRYAHLTLRGLIFPLLLPVGISCPKC